MIQFLLKLWGFLRPYRVRFFLGLFCGIGYGMANGMLVATIQNVLELVFNREVSLHGQLAKAPGFIQPQAQWLIAHVPDFHAPADGNHLGWALVVGAIPAVMLLRNSLQYLSIYLTNWAAVHAIADIRIRLFGHLQGLSLGFFNQARTGDLIARITSDTQALHVVLNNSLSSLVRDPVTLLCLISYNLLMQPKLTLVSALVFPLCIVPVVIYGRKVRKSARAVQSHNAELANLMHEAFTGSRVIKAYNLEDTVTRQFVGTIRKYASQLMRVARSSEIPGQFTELFAATGIALVFYYLTSLPMEVRPSLASLTSFIFTMVIIYPSVKQLTRLQNQIHQARAASERVFELLATENTIREPDAPKKLHADKADIVIENLCFSIGHKMILQNINLTVKAGQMVALVGASGSGKTTLANLLLRFYDPDCGCIKIGGLDLREVCTRDLRSQIAVVAQENILFNDTIRRNIELGRLGAKDDEIVAAAKHAHAYEFIRQRVDGFDTVIGEKGVSLSGGQRQRLAIARAVLRNAPILILDEATSALDTESERAVQSALDELMKGRTTFCIAHRLSTILHADLIVVLDQGRIVEQGRHEELVKLGGVYRNLYELQFAG